MKIMLLSQATDSVSSGNMLAFDTIGSKEWNIVESRTGNAQLLILLSIERR